MFIVITMLPIADLAHIICKYELIPISKILDICYITEWKNAFITEMPDLPLLIKSNKLMTEIMKFDKVDLKFVYEVDEETYDEHWDTVNVFKIKKITMNR